MIKNTILQGDVIDIIKTLLAESINCIITSPPYFQQRDYGLPSTDWDEVSYAPLHGLPPIMIPAMKCCLGREETIEAYVGHMVLVFRLLRPALRNDSVTWLNIGDSYANDAKRGGCNGNKNYTAIAGGYQEIRDTPAKTGLPPKNLCGIPWRLVLALQADGWTLRSDVIWEKSNGQPSSVTDRPTGIHEYLFLLSKSPRYWYDNEAIKILVKQSSLERLGRGVSENHKMTNGAPGQHSHSQDKPRVNVKFGGNKADGYGNRTLSGNEWDSKTGKANRRSVWRMATAQYPGSHFAVMPAEMAELCILAGCPSRVCVECGEPWARVIERESGDKKSMGRPKGKGQGGYGTSTSTLSLSGNGSAEWSKRGTKVQTIDFAPTCQCNAPHCPGIVLDPFFGSGTVGVVAKQHKRDWLGIELNSRYVEMAQERLDQTQPALFAT